MSAPEPLTGFIVEEVAEWLSGAGVTLFFAGTTYAVVRTSVVENWPRVTSKRLSADLREIGQMHGPGAWATPLTPPRWSVSCPRRNRLKALRQRLWVSHLEPRQSIPDLKT